MKRRNFLKQLFVLVLPLKSFAGGVPIMVSSAIGNFKRIYGDRKMKQEFFKFLQNVFHLYPEKMLHSLISETTKKSSNDQDVYLEVQSKLDQIAPAFSMLTYALPALFKQKDEMARETLTLLGERTVYDGYLEVGSSGRYLDYLEEKVTIKGKRYYADVKKPGYAFSEMIDRGQISVGATYIPMSDYHTAFGKFIPKESLDLVTVYVGFHHCPIELREKYITSIRATLRIGGKLVLRDHDCDTEEQRTLVALAHDVFNLGTNESWEYNEKEVRNFYSLEFICRFVESLGFKFDKRTLFQEGDPTKNALMLFTKV